MIYKGNCPICNAPWISKQPKKKFCGDKCKYESWRREHRPNIKPNGVKE